MKCITLLSLLTLSIAYPIVGAGNSNILETLRKFLTEQQFQRFVEVAEQTPENQRSQAATRLLLEFQQQNLTPPPEAKAADIKSNK